MRRGKASGPEIAKVARDHFGFESLRPGQEDAVRALVSGQDTLVVQPTGAGKSAIYQISGLMIEGVTVTGVSQNYFHIWAEEAECDQVSVGFLQASRLARSRQRWQFRGFFPDLWVTSVDSTA